MPPRWSVGCHDLPPWPTTRQLLEAGFATPPTAVSGVCGVILSVAAFIPSGLQARKIFTSRSVRGVSLLSVILNLFVNVLQFSVVLSQSGPLWCLLGRLAIWRFLGASLVCIQFALQVLGPTALIWVYFRIWAVESCGLIDVDTRVRASIPESRSGRLCCINNNNIVSGSQVEHAAPNDIEAAAVVLVPGPCGTRSRAKREQMRRFVLLSAGTVVVVMVASASMPCFVGPCGPSISGVSDVLSAAATMSTVCYLLPQIVLLCRTHDRGQLSVSMLLVQVVGNTAQSVTCFEEGASINAIIPYAVQGLECIATLLLYFTIASAPHR